MKLIKKWRLIYHNLRHLKVRQFQNEFMKLLFLPKYEQKIVRISALCKGQIISEANYLVLNSSKKRTKNFCPSTQLGQNFANILLIFRKNWQRKIASEIDWSLELVVYLVATAHSCDDFVKMSIAECFREIAKCQIFWLFLVSYLLHVCFSLKSEVSVLCSNKGHLNKIYLFWIKVIWEVFE